ncbi:hypothetical protein M885DRAFT_572161, partial [Pelagophyceae sp. CCMP2097]
ESPVPTAVPTPEPTHCGRCCVERSTQWGKKGNDCDTCTEFDLTISKKECIRRPKYHWCLGCPPPPADTPAPTVAPTLEPTVWAPPT